jgi:type IV secretion system protein VirB1
MITTAAFLALALQCSPDVAPDTMSRIVKTESSFNEWAIGVVGSPLKKQPQSREEALKAIKLLNEKGANYSVGLSQINRQYFSKNDIEEIFSPCTNLKMGANILKKCYSDALKESRTKREALEKSFSCYYSGNYLRGFKKEKDGISYVDRIVNADVSAVKVPALGDTGTEEQPAEQPQTSYDEWDVLQQYPRYRPQVPPPSGDVKEKKSDSRQEEKNDAKA